MASAFDGVKIIEISTGITGPYLAMLMSDLGADVIKVESPDGDPLRGSPGFLVWNRGKRSLKLDFNSNHDREAINRLIINSDILIYDFDSHLTKNLDLNFDSIRKQRPGLIICSVSPWGENGPQASKRGSGNLVSAYGGYTATQASFTGDPVFVVIPFIEYKTAFHGANALTAALFYRERTGKGQKIELSLLSDGFLYGVWGDTLTTLIWELTTPFGHAPTYRIYQTKDGWVQIAAGNPTFCGKLFITMGQEMLFSDSRFENVPWGILNREDRKALEKIIGDWTGQFTNKEILDLLDQNDIPCGPVRTAEEFASHPQVKHLNLVTEINDPIVGKVKQMGMLVTMEATPGKIKGPCPLLGQHSREILADLGYSEEQIGGLSG